MSLRNSRHTLRRRPEEKSNLFKQTMAPNIEMKDLTRFLKANGIKHRLSVTHTPEQNGVAERRNRTLIDMVRCLLFQTTLPPSFWGEAINTANYIRNRCPSNSIGGQTPFEKWTGNIPNVSHFQEFGCKVYTLDKNPNKKKLDSRSKRGIFVGYSDQSKAYRVWLPDERKIDITRDVRFIKTSNKPHKYDNSQDFIENDQKPLKSTEILIPFPSNSTEDSNSPDCSDNDPQSQNSDNGHSVASNEDDSKRGRGRPRKVMTGFRGRPRKYYHTADMGEITANMVEIPLEEAIHGPDAEQWFQAMASEMKSLIKNNTWTLVERPLNREVIGSRVVLGNKYDQHGSLERRKARIVARGFTQRPGVDFNETFAPVTRIGSIRLLTALAAQSGMIMNHFDISTAYLKCHHRRRSVHGNPSMPGRSTRNDYADRKKKQRNQREGGQNATRP